MRPLTPQQHCQKSHWRWPTALTKPAAVEAAAEADVSSDDSEKKEEDEDEGDAVSGGGSDESVSSFLFFPVIKMTPFLFDLFINPYFKVSYVSTFTIPLNPLV
jgi:hypothetical protein